MFRRWHTGHSLAAGVLGGLLLSQHAWTVAVIAFVLGLVAGSALHLTRWAAAALREKVMHARRDRKLSKPRPVAAPWDTPPAAARPYNRVTDQGGLPDGY